ncbi:hypothetical protein MUK42_05091 [Musa troglodytarum]|uniref:Uncharacterized protein n=1 Tax=Musa troglodytarum TaxID=320322 RepID=A0A9E7EQ57_9LILI|nr:hypothetical protein MUK42_05091 [Musa troglodytarum]
MGYQSLLQGLALQTKLLPAEKIPLKGRDHGKGMEQHHAKLESDQEGAAYFGELEEALMQGVDGLRETEDRKSFIATSPATLEIFPSWPMRFQQTPSVNTQSARSTDSGAAQNSLSHLESASPNSRTASSDQSTNHKRPQETMMASGASRTEAPRNPHPSSQEERKMTGSTAARDGKVIDSKTLRRLAQNREAAKKSRLKKKAYVQQLESSRIRLQQLEQDLQRARSQGLLLGVSGGNAAISSGAAMFDMEYGRWLDDNCKIMSDLRAALEAHLPDDNLGVVVDHCIRHYDDLFRLKAIVAQSDVFHLLNGIWKTPAERCFLWMGGFRPSELIKILIRQLDPLTDQQWMGMRGFQHSSQQAEEALSRGLEQVHQSLAQTVAAGSLRDDGIDVGNYVGHAAIAMGKLADLEGFIGQADNLRQQTLHQLRQQLTTKQAARCFLAIGEYFTRLRALSSLWASHHQDVVPATADPHITHFSAF